MRAMGASHRMLSERDEPSWIPGAAEPAPANRPRQTDLLHEPKERMRGDGPVSGPILPFRGHTTPGCLEVSS